MAYQKYLKSQLTKGVKIFNSMETEAEIQLKLNRFKETVRNSKRIKDELKELLEAGTIYLNKGSGMITKEHIWAVYYSRLDYLIEQGKYNESFAKLLKGLENEPDDLKLAITGVETKNRRYAVFTDVNYSKLFGVVYPE
jgi:tetratricopeptide (TPR) repeat protein